MSCLPFLPGCRLSAMIHPQSYKEWPLSTLTEAIPEILFKGSEPSQGKTNELDSLSISRFFFYMLMSELIYMWCLIFQEVVSFIPSLCVSDWLAWWWGCGNGHTGAWSRRRSGQTPSWSAFVALSSELPPVASATRNQTPMVTKSKGSLGMPACDHEPSWCTLIRTWCWVKRTLLSWIDHSFVKIILNIRAFLSVTGAPSWTQGCPGNRIFNILQLEHILGALVASGAKFKSQCPIM